MKTTTINLSIIYNNGGIYMFIEKESLVNEAKKSKKLPNFIWAIILALLFMNVGSLIGAIGITPLYLTLNNFSVFRANTDLLLLLITLVSLSLIHI